MNEISKFGIIELSKDIYYQGKLEVRVYKFIVNKRTNLRKYQREVVYFENTLYFFSFWRSSKALIVDYLPSNKINQWI